jgi:hypothetical protein
VLTEDVFRKSGQEVISFLNRDDIRIVKCICLQESEFIPYIKDKIRNCEKKKVQTWRASNAFAASDSNESIIPSTSGTASSSPQVLFSTTAMTPPERISTARSVSVNHSYQHNLN